MKDRARIKTALERNKKAVSLRPALGRGTAVTRVNIREGLLCEVEDGPWKLTADYSEKNGGRGQGPDPGVFGRSALGSCLAMGYVLWAAECDLPLDGVSVEVQADYDAAGHYGLSNAPCGYGEIRYTVSIESSAPEEDVRRMIEEADKHSSYLELFRDPQNLKRAIKHISTEVR
jgi:uncharacterized OsmC-like protein